MTLTSGRPSPLTPASAADGTAGLSRVTAVPAVPAETSRDRTRSVGAKTQPAQPVVSQLVVVWSCAEGPDVCPGADALPEEVTSWAPVRPVWISILRGLDFSETGMVSVSTPFS